MFCSAKCLNEANEKFHLLECDFSCDCFWEFFTISVQAAFRTFLAAINICGGSFDHLNDFILKEKNTKCTVFDYDVKDTMFRKNILLAMNSLCTNEDERPFVEKLRKVIVCVILCDFLLKNSSLKSVLETDGHEYFFVKFMYKHIQIAESNYHELYALSPSKIHQENEQFGVGSYPFASLLNHSCAPNIFRLTFDGLNYIIVSRPIGKGEQLFDNYGYKIQ